MEAGGAHRHPQRRRHDGSLVGRPRRSSPARARTEKAVELTRECIDQAKRSSREPDIRELVTLAEALERGDQLAEAEAMVYTFHHVGDAAAYGDKCTAKKGEPCRGVEPLRSTTAKRPPKMPDDFGGDLEMGKRIGKWTTFDALGGMVAAVDY